ncbi:MAG: hypothetical protein M5U12_11410 [Verrucomicrobia bacterium]|nr:hypothetical protein [Verrucomicrobiota bacterium]
MLRTDGGGVNLDWADPPAGTDPSLQHIALHHGGSLQYELAVPPGKARRVALALCEGWWNEPGRRVQVLSVEGAEPQTVDTVADLGRTRHGHPPRRRRHALRPAPPDRAGGPSRIPRHALREAACRQLPGDRRASAGRHHATPRLDPSRGGRLTFRIP